MRSIGTFRGWSRGIFVPEVSVSMNQQLSKEHVYQNIKPKVGVLSSLERTHARASLYKNNHRENIYDVSSALRRVRNGGPVSKVMVRR